MHISYINIKYNAFSLPSYQNINKHYAICILSYGYQKEIFEYEDNNSKNRPNLLSNDLYN